MVVAFAGGYETGIADYLSHVTLSDRRGIYVTMFDYTMFDFRPVWGIIMVFCVSMRILYYGSFCLWEIYDFIA